MIVLELRNLLKTFRSPDQPAHVIIDVPAFDLPTGAQIGLEGSSGSGKTTLLHLIAGILRPDRGQVRVAGTDLVGLSESGRDRFRAQHVGYVFQTFNLLQGYTALENVELAMRFGRGVDGRWARSLLERVGLSDRLRHRPGQLSVGQQQRVAVARALANRPQLVLADEPTGNLDPRQAGAALTLMREVCRENGAALLVVSHDLAILAQLEHVTRLADINRALATNDAAARGGAPVPA